MINNSARQPFSFFVLLINYLKLHLHLTAGEIDTKMLQHIDEFYKKKTREQQTTANVYEYIPVNFGNFFCPFKHT